MENLINTLINNLNNIGNELDNYTIVSNEQVRREFSILYQKPSTDSIDIQKKYGHVLTMGQLYHIASLIINKTDIDSSYSEDEHNIYNLLKSMVDRSYSL